MITIKERPIIMADNMAQACYEGYKTMTRRVVRPQPSNEYVTKDGACLPVHFFDPVDDYFVPSAFAQHMKYMDKHLRIKCPYGVPGDRLWVKEAWQPWAQGMMWRADDPDVINSWRSARCMPRRACRTLLEITSVRVERLQGISEEDAEAEGAPCIEMSGSPGYSSYTNGFSVLWDSLAKPGEKWEDNPWVWVIGFRRVEEEED